MASLPNFFWARFDEVLARKGILRRDVERRLRRNKNTFTKWFSQDRPDLRLSDLEEICGVLDISPGDMLSRDDSIPEQLEFHFDGAETHQIELALEGQTVILRKAPKRATTE